MDIGFQLKEESLQNGSAQDKAFYNEWDNLYNLYGTIVGVGVLTKTAGKCLIVNKNEIWKSIQTSPAKLINLGKGIKAALKNIQLYKATNIGVKNRMYAILLSCYLEIKISTFVTQLSSGVSFSVKNSRLIVIKGAYETEIAKIIESATDGVTLNNLKLFTGKADDIASVEAKFAKVSDNGTKGYELIKTKSGQFWLREVNGAGNLFDLSAFKNVIAKTPGIDNTSLTNLPKSFWDDTFKYLPDNTSPLKSQIDNIKLNGDSSGKLTEQLVEDIMKSQGYKVGNGRYYGDYDTARNGIDGFFYKGDISNPTEILVIDSKQMSASGSASLNGASPSTQLPIQMKESWIEYIAINKLTDINNPIQQSTKNAILNADSGFIQKYVAAVDKSTGQLKFLKLGESF